ncbi:hypothetical protein HMPREF9538_05023 [Klebsiella sp. MS 92-3]|nr:hypothetical protein HMPREF9538_05023 [Klebsiella sp. MS 92-3]
MISNRKVFSAFWKSEEESPPGAGVRRCPGGRGGNQAMIS